METAAQTTADTLYSSAAQMAETLNMKEDKLDWRTTWDRQLTLLVTPAGIALGRVRLEHGQMRDYMYERFYLNEVLLLEKRYGATDNDAGWEYMPTVNYPLADDAVIYVGW